MQNSHGVRYFFKFKHVYIFIKDGRKFHDLSSNMFLVIALLSENLKKRYDDNAIIENVTTHNVQPTSVNGENYKICMFD